MKAAYCSLPCYAGDVSGACSSLYELGGMVVIHDPSGCNSTYNTHDETRWYDRESLIFISGLKESDAILGTDKRLVDEVVESALTLKPAFVALLGSPVPYLSGVDLPALARLVEKRCGIPAFALPTSGMRDYVWGAGSALAEVARRFVGQAGSARPRGVNVLGATPLDFCAPGGAHSAEEWLRGEGWEVVSTWAMGSDLERIGRAAEASVNLVVSAAGLAAARVLRERFGTPWVAGLPVPGFEDHLVAALERAAATGESDVAYLRCVGGIFHGAASAVPDVAFVGEPVAMGSLAAAIALGRGCGVRGLCPLEADKVLTGGAAAMRGEDALRQALAGVPHVVADPLYAPVLSPGTELYALPHLAFSGRCFLSQAQDLCSFAIKEDLP